jgi:hypothetical protein
MANVITKHKDLSEQFIEPELTRFRRATANLYLYGVDKKDLIKAVRLVVKSLDDEGFPLASPRKKKR